MLTFFQGLTIIIIIITEIWPKQQRHHEDHYSQSKYSRWAESESVVTAAEYVLCIYNT